MKIAIIDYGMGNLRSVEKAFHKVGATGAFVTDDPAQVAAADKAVLPGDGAFDATMHSLRRSGVDAIARDFIASGRPFLGICVGMQVLLTDSEEGEPGVRGLDVVPGHVRRFPRGSGPEDPADRLERRAVRPRLPARRGPAGRRDGLLPELLLLRPRRPRRRRRRDRLRRRLLLGPAPGQRLGHPVPPRKVRLGRPDHPAQLSPRCRLSSWDLFLIPSAMARHGSKIQIAEMRQGRRYQQR